MIVMMIIEITMLIITSKLVLMILKTMISRLWSTRGTQRARMETVCLPGWKEETSLRVQNYLSLPGRSCWPGLSRGHTGPWAGPWTMSGPTWTCWTGSWGSLSSGVFADLARNLHSGRWQMSFMRSPKIIRM